jgi:hypothetical protein
VGADEGAGEEAGDEAGGDEAGQDAGSATLDTLMRSFLMRCHRLRSLMPSSSAARTWIPDVRFRAERICRRSNSSISASIIMGKAGPSAPLPVLSNR